MGELADAVNEGRKLNQEMKRLALEGGLSDNLDVIRLRSRYTKAVLSMMQAQSSDSLIQGRPELKQTFDRLFSEMRSALSLHQSNWGPREIERDPEGYKQSVRTMSEIQEAFYDWSAANLF